MDTEPNPLVALHGDSLAAYGPDGAALISRRVTDPASRIMMEVARRAYEAMQGRTPSSEFRTRLAVELQAAAGQLAMAQAPENPAHAIRRRIVATAFAGGAAVAGTALVWWVRRDQAQAGTAPPAGSQPA